MSKLIDGKLQEFEKKFVGDNWIYGIGYVPWEYIEPWLAKSLGEVYQNGRQSVIDEWEEEKKKLLQGFSYKPKSLQPK